MIEILGNWAVDIAFAIIIGVGTWLFKKYAYRIHSTKSAVKALLHSEIVRVYETHIGLGYCPRYVLESVELLYKEYHELNGNHGVEVFMDKLRKMPSIPPKEGEING